MGNLVGEKINLEYLNRFKDISDEVNLILFISDLRKYTIDYFKRITDFSKENWLLERINEYIVYSGKMLRSSFFYLFVLGMIRGNSKDVFDFDYDFWDRLFTLGAVFELSHSATLVHDDILDGAKKRRGKDAVHVKFGIDGAIIFGDILIISVLNKAFEVEPIYSKILMEALKNMCLGEILQYQNKFNVFLDEKEYFRILSLKTGVLFGAISKIAYHLSCKYLNINYDESIACRLAEIFDKFGVAFQIVDDLLDYTQDEKILKKDSNNDLLSGRVTYPLIVLLSNNDKEKMRKIWLKNPSSFSGFVRKLIKNNKSIILNSFQKTNEFMDMDSFSEVLNKINFDSFFGGALRNLVYSLVNRNY